ncbi:MAG: sulfatase-like hydrolase/transferase [Planctomycetota bacterium]|jgi:phosphoglycerol transferase
MYSQLLLFVSLAIFVLATLFLKDRNTSHGARYFHTVLAFSTIILSGTYLISDYFTGSGIDESVFYHLIYGLDGAGFREYMDLMIFAGVLMIVAVFGAFAVFRMLKPVLHQENKVSKLWMAHVTLPVAFMVNPGSVDILEATGLMSFSESSQLSFTRQYQMPSLDSNTKKTLNLVFIYLESLERTYFDKNIFPGLITGLRELEKESLTFTNINQVFGTQWTIGGMTASQCGIPLVTPSLGNSMSGMDRFLSGATCMGDKLNDRGYHLTYMGGSSLDFAGKGKFYRSHGFKDVHGRAKLVPTLQDPSYKTGWGLYDDSLFDRAYKRFESLAASGNRFGLFMLTLDTHHPNGYPSKRCAGKVYRDGNNPILNAVLCSDFLVSEFVRKIRNSRYAQNTLIVIASDHLAMPNTAWDQLQKGDRKNLFMAIDPNRRKYSRFGKAGSTLDIAPTVLSMLGYDVPSFGLGRDLLRSKATLFEQVKEPSKTLKGWTQQLAGFWNYPVIKDGILIDSKRKHIRIADRVIKAPALLTLAENMVIENIKFEFFSHKKLISYVNEMHSDTPLLWVDSCQKLKLFNRKVASTEFCLFAGRLGSDHGLTMNINGEAYIARAILADAIGGTLSPSVFEERKQQIKAMIEYGTAEIDDASTPQSKHPKMQRKKSMSLKRVAHAGGGYMGETYTNSLDALTHNINNGYELFEIDFSWTADKHLVCIHDWGDSFKRSFGIEAKEIPTLTEFQQIVHDKSEFRKCTLDSLINFLDKNPLAYVVTDVKKDNIRALTVMATKFPQYENRIIPQIYQPEDYELVRHMGYKNIIWTLYRYSKDDDAVLKHARMMKLYAITMPKERAKGGLALKLAELDIPSYVHTVNTRGEFNEFSKLGITEIYTDFLHPKNAEIIDIAKERREFDSAAPERKYATSRQRLTLLGSGSKPHGAFKIRPHDELVDKRVSEIGIVGDADVAILLNLASFFADVNAKARFMPTNITGGVQSSGHNGVQLNLAIAINGTIRAVTRSSPLERGTGTWSAVVGETSFQVGRNDIEVFIVSAFEGKPGLERTVRLNYFLSETGQSGNEVITSSNGASIRVIAGAVAGYLDIAEVEENVVKFGGWAADVRNSQLPKFILIFVNGKFAYSGRSHVDRLDVVKHYGNPAIWRAGFYYAFPSHLFNGIDNLEVRIFAVSKNGVASELYYPQGYKWKKKR